MPKYHFDFCSKTDKVLDHTGVTLDSLKAAHSHALGMMIKAMKATSDTEFWEWRIEITDTRGRHLISVPFALVASCNGRFERRQSVSEPAENAADHLRRRFGLLKGQLS